MPENNTKPTPTNNNPEPPADTKPNQPTDIIPSIVEKINEAQNILIALSSDPSVDEMAAAIGLSLFLDKLGKRATAIYSGKTPNALEFLKPEETFESTTDALQDFVIALSKDKADHLRYKLDGDFVKIYITPYRTRIGEDDLNFSYGDFNIDLVLALDVANGTDLDATLREHGRIMHDAVIINITNGDPGKLGEIEWSDKSASSVSEMVAELAYSINNDAKLGEEEATAFLTGIVAMTDRFSNAKTTPEAMKMSSRLMESGANQQLISKNIVTSASDSALSSEKETSKPEESSKPDEPTSPAPEAKNQEDKSVLDIKHEEKEEAIDASAAPATDINIDANVNADAEPEDKSNLLDDLKAAEETLARTGTETTPEESNVVKLDNSLGAEGPESSAPPESGFISEKPEKVIQPAVQTPDSFENLSATGTNKYGQMLEDALASIETPVAAEQPNNLPEQSVETATNPATSNTPAVPTNPEINGVPSINYMPLPGEEVLPPPPTPPIDMGDMGVSSPENSPAIPTVEPIQAPAAEASAAPTPDAFKIPGM